MIVEYRTWTSVADVPFSDESKWLPLTRYLDREYPDLGPVTTWEETAIVLIFADDEPDPATAAEKAARIVSEALHATGLADRFPTVYQVEPATDEVSADLVPA
ncbi:MAG TPA: hypothetical protein VG053_08115 [Solirubrobacteraceae bacterium]|jgi:hypothetical protein|nr:hypothetical protein [Solirubrobacteraceae bacterium]